MPRPDGRWLHTRLPIGARVRGSRREAVVLEENARLQEQGTHHDVSLHEVWSPGGSSARSSIDGGTARPSALAVFLPATIRSPASPAAARVLPAAMQLPRRSRRWI